jgi:hypothetical protein
LAHTCTLSFWRGDWMQSLFCSFFFFLVGITDCQPLVQGPATTVKCYSSVTT